MTEFRVKAGDLRTAVARVIPAIERRNTIPILSNIRVNVGDKWAALSATNMDMELSASVDADVTEGGAFTVTAAPLSRFLAVMDPAEVLSITEADNSVVVAGGGASITLSGLPADDFPDTPMGDAGPKVTIPAATLSKVLRGTAYAISREQTRYYLNGIHVRRKAGVLTLEATDGHRLVQYAVPAAEGDAFTKESAIIPRAACEIMRAGADGADKDAVVSIVQCARGVVVMMPNGVVMRAKAIDGTFPDVERVMPEASETVATIDRRRLLRALDIAASVLSRGRYSQVVGLDFDGTRLTITGRSPENGTACAPCPMASTGPRFEIGVNQKYLRQFLRNAEGDTVSCAITSHCDPMVWTDPATPDALALLMPCRI